MQTTTQVARDISYADATSSALGRAVIRAMENATGRQGLIKRAEGYEQQLAQGADFWSVMLQRYGLSLRIRGGSLSNIPTAGPLILVANHPYGILDGMMMGHILSETRGPNFRILAHQAFSKSAELQRVILSVSFQEDRAAVQLNLQSRRQAEMHLQEGGALGIFPGGTVSTAARLFSPPMDPHWRSFTARMISRSDAAVLPLFFPGTTTRLFQIASRLHPALRMGLLIKEFARRVDQPVDVVIGEPLPQAEIRSRATDGKALMDFLRKATYDLSPEPIDSGKYGFEFEKKHKAEARVRQMAFKG